jgi:hypothetical protein
MEGILPHVLIGTCPACEQALKVKEHAPRKHMHITCHCGWHGDVEVNDALVAHASELRAHGAGHRRRKSPWERWVKSLVGSWQRAMVKRRH